MTEDGDREGCLRLGRLPSAEEAETIREVLGKRIELSPEELERRQESGRRLAAL